MTAATARDTRTAVLDSAARIARESGAETISIKALTESSGVSNGSIYHHFGSRDGVIAALVLDVFSSYQQGVIESLESSADAEAGICGMIEHHLEWVESNPGRAGLLMGQRDRVAAGPWGRKLAGQNREFLAAVSDWLARQTAANQLPEVGIDLAHALVFAPAQEVCALWLAGRIREKPTSFATRLAPAGWAAISAAPSTAKGTA